MASLLQGGSRSGAGTIGCCDDRLIIEALGLLRLSSKDHFTLSTRVRGTPALLEGSSVRRLHLVLALMEAAEGLGPHAQSATQPTVGAAEAAASPAPPESSSSGGGDSGDGGGGGGGSGSGSGEASAEVWLEEALGSGPLGRPRLFRLDRLGKEFSARLPKGAAGSLVTMPVVAEEQYCTWGRLEGGRQLLVAGEAEDYSVELAGALSAHAAAFAQRTLRFKVRSCPRFEFQLCSLRSPQHAASDHRTYTPFLLSAKRVPSGHA